MIRIEKILQALSAMGLIVGLVITISGCTDLDLLQEIRDRVEGPGNLPVINVLLDKNATIVIIGATEQLTATVEPDDATDSSVTWTSDNENVATVDSDGLVMVVNKGAATIKVTTTDGGFTDTCDVTVDYPAGYQQTYTAGSISFDLHYVPSVTFPTGTDDLGGEVTVDSFWMGEAEVTNALMVMVMDWAYNNGKFSDTVDDPNEINGTTAKHGDKELLDLDALSMKINYSAGNITCDSGFQEYPVSWVSWYGAVMFCNWLTEMIDGNADEVVYVGVDDGDGIGTAGDGILHDDEYDEDTSKTGFRLSSSNEFELAARYRDDEVNTVSGYSDPWFTKGNSLSGATTFHNDSIDGAGEPGKSANDAVAVSSKYWDGDSWEDTGQVLTVVKSKADNTLGLYDMSGNIYNWVFDENGNWRILRGGSCGNPIYLQVGYLDLSSGVPPHQMTDSIGFRIARTQ